MSLTTLMLQPWTTCEIRKVALVKATVPLNSITSSFLSFHKKKNKLKKSGDQQIQRYVEGVDSKQ